MDAALEEEARLHTEYLPQTKEEWKEHIKKGIKPAIDYFFVQMNGGGERSDAVALYRAARVFNPLYASNITIEDAHASIENLRIVPALDDDEIIRHLKSSFASYKSEAAKILQKPGSVLQWHYSLFTELESNRIADMKSGKCRYCRCQLNNPATSWCNCSRRMKCWWNTCKVLALLQTSSAASERVFSLLKNFWGDKQNRTLGDVIFLSLALKFNKRSIHQFDFEVTGDDE